jgi:hypothetical protein
MATTTLDVGIVVAACIVWAKNAQIAQVQSLKHACLQPRTARSCLRSTELCLYIQQHQVVSPITAGRELNARRVLSMLCVTASSNLTAAIGFPWHFQVQKVLTISTVAAHISEFKHGTGRLPYALQRTKASAIVAQVCVMQR